MALSRRRRRKGHVQGVMSIFTEISVSAGVFLGLGAAFCQSLSYLFSRRFVRGVFENAGILLVLSHGAMALFSVVLLPFFWPQRWPPISAYILPLMGTSISYLVGQAGLFLALRSADASRVSPLLGLKIIILALICAGLLGRDYFWMQWVAVGLSVLAAALLNRFGGRLPWQSLLWVLLACGGYALSDLSIPPLVEKFSAEGLMRASVFATCISYILCGVVMLPFLPLLPLCRASAWLDAVPFSLAWFAAMLLLYACFSTIGVVYGNIVQSSRGVISILIRAAVAARGWEHLETKVSRVVILQRVAAAVLLSAAIALFHLGS